jgi:hypothetical protein
MPRGNHFVSDDLALIVVDELIPQRRNKCERCYRERSCQQRFGAERAWFRSTFGSFSFFKRQSRQRSLASGMSYRLSVAFPLKPQGEQFAGLYLFINTLSELLLVGAIYNSDTGRDLKMEHVVLQGQSLLPLAKTEL